MTEELPGEGTSAGGTAGLRRQFGGPVKGKNCSLYGTGATTDGCFDAVSGIVEASLRRTADPARLESLLAGREEAGNCGLTTQAPLFEDPTDGSER